MNTKLKISLLGGAVLTLLAAGCVERREYVPVYAAPPAYAPSTEGANVVVEAPSAPPPVRVEVVPVAPGPAYVWAPGYWSWNGGWIWVGGRYVMRPHYGAVWIGPRWVHHGRHFIYVRGHWR